MKSPLCDTESIRIARDWPGKSYDDVYHPALWHMLDVGAVATRLLALQPLAETQVDATLAFLITLHDIGKVSESFRKMLQEGQRQQRRHWEHSAAILIKNDTVIAEAIGGDGLVRKILYEAVSGHHGGPRTVLKPSYKAQQLQEIGDAAMDDAVKVIRAIASLFPGASLDEVREHDAKALSWKLNGLTVQSDWIGSNTDWFAATEPDMPILNYWEQAKDKAKAAVENAGLHGASPALHAANNVIDKSYKTYPMQAKAIEVSLPDGPTIAVIEDATGAGKTEAALIVATRMMAAGKARGVFFALPTMATSNAMLSRLEDVTPALFDGKPSLALSHSRARLSDAYRKIKGRDGSNPESGPHCGSWLADDRRRILLADMGVGTIDQVLLSALPTRFNGLRLKALSEKVLIVDEAHSYDPYMCEQLKRLLTFQSRLGGSAVLMTATLPAKMKAEFVTSFQEGLGTKKRGFARRNLAVLPAVPGPYPALTVAGKAQESAAVDPAASTVRKVAVKRLTETQQAVDLITIASRKGAACIWIRNAVDDAIGAVESLRSVGISADLLHARFAVCDRLAKENAVLSRFGKHGKGRTGQVLVATQVTEQSLDIDFDVMVSDLAPIGAMIQRAGRLWRHMDDRPAETRAVEGPHLHVLSPDPDVVENDRWLQQVLAKGACVYPQSDTWRSAKALFDAGEIRTPEGLRELIETVHGANQLDVPEMLKSAEFKYEGQSLIERQIARNSVLDAMESFNQVGMKKIWDDEEFPTRLGVPQVTLALAVEVPKGLAPYPGDGQTDWAMSEVQLSAAKFEELTCPDQSRPDIQDVKKCWPEGRAEYTIVAPLGQGGQICDGLRYTVSNGAVFGISADSDL